MSSESARSSNPAPELRPEDRILRLRKRLDFRWDVIDVIIGGKSLLDSNMGLSGFPMAEGQDADRFMRSYGYDLEDPIEQAECLGNFHEAINFVRKYFLQPENPEGLKLEIPRKILEVTDIRDLLLMASMSYPGQTTDTQGNLLRDWSCALLKVVHAIAHADKDIRSAYFGEIQKQIFDRFYKAVQRDSDEKLYLGENPDDPLRVSLVAFETKPKKQRESMLLKMLHKNESVADDIFDRVGLRFITSTRLDALRVVKYLKDNMIVMPANIKPSRSRNTLLDVDNFKQDLKEFLGRLEDGQMDPDGVEKELEKLMNQPSSGGADNPHSSQHYRSIQFTCRQLIKLRNPLYEDLKSLKSIAKKQPIAEEMEQLIERIDLQYLKREVRFFYPYEVQVMDQHSHEENERGRGAHSEYKKSQIQTAMIRVMGNLVNARG